MYNQNQVNKIIMAELAKHGIEWSKDRIYVLAVRGNDGQDDLGVFDDRCWVVKDMAIKGVWDMNTNPSNNNEKGRATLKLGVWKYQAGKHHISKPAPQGRAAFIQKDEVTVSRFGEGDETGFFGINHHDAKSGSTSSLGCQTFKQYAGVSDFYNQTGTGYRDVLYRMLGVTPEEIMKNPDGKGDWFYYVLIDLQTAEAHLAE